MGTDQVNYYVVNDASIDLITERYNARNRSDNSANYYQIALSILEYLKDVDLSNESTQKLVYIFRSLLSQEELLILFYYMKLHRQFNNKFVDSDIFDFAMKYHLFENVDALMFPNLTIKNLFDIKRYK
ncbi:MAG: hypothetical protein J0L67_00800 [Cytophagales bacterium]|nr:hypothetical protein [Cytophagales bacterium]